MEQVNTRLHELDALVKGIALRNGIEGDFAYACAEVEIWRTIEESVRTKASRAGQRRNARLPIQQLPIEVVLEVLRMVVAPFLEQADYYTVLKQISAVCHRWRQIINGTPALWSRIHGWDPCYVVDEALRRSNPRALDVWFDAGCGMNRMDLDTFAEKLIPHIGRCQTLTLEYWGGSYGPRRVKELLELSAPQLKRVVLHDRTCKDDFTEVEMFAGQATLLKEVEIHGVTCRWESAAFRGLKTLSIFGVSFQSFNQVLEILHHSPTLVKLKLHPISFNSGTNPVDIDPTFRQINLPHLSSLSTRPGDMRQAEILLKCINAPDCNDLHLLITEAQDIEGGIARLAALWLGQVRSLVPNPRSISVSIMAGRTVLSVSRSDGLGRLSLLLTYFSSPDNTARTLGGVNRVLRDHLPTSESVLQLDNEVFSFLDHQNLFNELLRLPPVTRLDVGNPSSNFEEPRYWVVQHHWDRPLFPSLKFLRFFTQSEQWIMNVIDAVFHSPAIDAKGRVIDIEVHSRTEQESEHRTETLAPRIKGVIGEINRLSFVLTPLIDTFHP